MIFKDEDAFARHIRVGMPLPVYMIYGDEGWQKQRWLGKLTAMATGGDDYAVQRYQGPVSSDTLADAVYEISFGGGRRCVVADDLPVHSMQEGERKKLSQLVKELPSQPGAGVLVFFFSSVNAEPKRGGKEAKAGAKYASFIKEIDKAGGGIVKFGEMSENELISLLNRAAEKRGCRLDTGCGRHMLLRCGTDARNLLGELKKLADYKGSGSITIDDIDMVTVATPSANIFRISDAVARRDYTAMCTLMNELLGAGEEPTAILYHISEAYINLSRAKAARTAGKGSGDMAKDFPKQYARREFLAERAITAQARFTRETLQRSLGILMDGERRMKSTRVENEVILQEIAARLFAVK